MPVARYHSLEFTQTINWFIFVTWHQQKNDSYNNARNSSRHNDDNQAVNADNKQPVHVAYGL